MKRILKKFLFIIMALSLAGGAFSVNAADDVKNFEEIINDDMFKFDKNVNFFSNNDLEIVDRYIEDLDDEYYIIIEDATDIPSVVAYSTVHRVEKARHCYVQRKSDNKVMVQFSLHGLFGYDGKTSACTDTKSNVYNNATNIYTILQKTHSKVGMWAKAECAVRNKTTGTRLGRAFRIGVKPDGSVLKPPMTTI